MSGAPASGPIRSDEDLTPDQLATESYLDWDDEALGRAVRGIAVQLADELGRDALDVTSLACCLAAVAAERGLKDLTLELSELRRDEQLLGSWRITLCKQVDSES